MSNQTEVPSQNEGLPEGPVRRLIAHTEDLTSVIRREITILEARRPSDIAPLQAEKAELSNAYEHEFKAVKQNQKLLGDKDSPVRQRLREVTETFNSELVRLGRILLRMKSVSEGMIHAIGQEVSRRRQSVRNYSPDAEVKEPQMAKPLPIAMNEVI